MQLPPLDRQAAVEAFLAVAHDDSIDDGLRSSAAEQLARLDPRAAAEAFRSVSDDEPRHEHPAEGATTLRRPPRAPQPPPPPRPW